MTALHSRGLSAPASSVWISARPSHTPHRRKEDPYRPLDPLRGAHPVAELRRLQREGLPLMGKEKSPRPPPGSSSSAATPTGTAAAAQIAALRFGEAAL